MSEIYIEEDVRTVFNILNNAGFECFMVGGCVRDFLLDKKPNDIDFATNATPGEIEECFYGFNLIKTGLEHGTVTVIINKNAYEITTYRVDGDYIDNRRPESVEFVQDITNDLARRDFTINALAYNPSRGIIDCFNGIEDLQNKVIRCVNDPMKRLNEDALRILRALRFSATLGYAVENKTKEACFKLAHLLKNISAERVFAELCKTLVQPDTHKIMFEYIDIWGEIIPELLKMKGFDQRNPHHVHDVLKHTCVALEGADSDLIVRLTILFHDVGKPDSFTMDENGNGHFYGHALKSEEITRVVLNRLKVDNRTKEQVLTLIKYHDLDLQATEKYVKRLCYKLGSLDMVKKLILVQRADNFGQAPLHSERIGKFNQIDNIIKKLEKENLSFSLKDLAVDGYDMINLGLSGKNIGKSLDFILDAVLNEKVLNKRDELLNYIKNNFSG